VILLISASWVARITSVSHQLPTHIQFLINPDNLYWNDFEAGCDGTSDGDPALKGWAWRNFEAGLG
jgi:hypothetical protein